ncbi:Flagellum-specific peptidoglycan hydrolase FlgJ [Peptoniphilus sp. ING2-D1G]|nr:Flagellum-specific peptidoglycan hydrolase FlgJ [Peptoniphilus sp. ING2-D1G]
MKKKTNSNAFFFFSAFIFIIIVFVVISKDDRGKRENSLNYKEEYIQNTQRLATDIAKKYNLHPSVVLAQSALESGFGKSDLSLEYNNYFGIKSGGEGVNLNTVEYVRGEKKILNENFRVYDSKRDSFKDYAELISKSPRYEAVLRAQDYTEACKALQSGGYATDPSYADKIIEIINHYELYKLDENFS